MSSTLDIERPERNGRCSTSKDVDKDSSNGPHLGLGGWICAGAIGAAIAFGGFVVGETVATRYWKNTPEQRLASELDQSFERSRERRKRRQRVNDGDLREDQTCVVCLTNAKEVILLPCGHVCLCDHCAISINNNCPMCRQKILYKTAAYI